MSWSKQISPTGSAGCAAVASFLPGILGAGTDPVVFGALPAVAGAALAVAGAALAVAGVFGSAPRALGAPLALLLAGLGGIGAATRVQVSPPQRKPSTQP